MAADQLRRIQRTTAVLGVAATAGAGLLWGTRGMLAAAVGGAIAAANFWVLRRLGARAIVRATTGASVGQASALAFGLLLKMVLLFGTMWVVIKKFDLAAMPLGLGFSAVVVAIFLAALGPQDERASSSTSPIPSSSPSASPSPAPSGSPR